MAYVVIPKSIVWCKIPKAGLGNQLFPIMKACLFAYKHNIPVYYTNYHQFRLGPYLRGEKSKRAYLEYFSFQGNIGKDIWDRFRMIIFSRKLPVITEPGNETYSKKSSVYFFGNTPHWNDYFDGLKSERSLVIELFYSFLNVHIKQAIEKANPPVIGIHIRMGDFRRLSANEDFSKVGAVRTPEDYFIETIQTIRTINGSNLPVFIFTDGYRDELSRILEMTDVQLIEGNPDIVDMVLLSKSKIIITSAGSTFSYWAGFLSEAPVIMHPDHIHEPLRYTANTGNKLYEGSLDFNNKELIKYIKEIKK